MTIFIARFPYIIVFTVDCAVPPEDISINEAAKQMLFKRYHTIASNLPW